MPRYRLHFIGTDDADQDVDLERSYSEGDKLRLDGSEFIVDTLITIDQLDYPILRLRRRTHGLPTTGAG